MKRPFFFVLLAFLTFTAIGLADSPVPDRAAIDREIARGRFAEARQMIDRMILETKPAPETVWELRFEQDRLDRIEIDFSADPEKVLQYIKRYYPDLTEEQLARWKKEKSLEVMVIDGKERYFDRCAANLFRIDAEAKAKKREIDVPKPGPASLFLRKHIEEICEQARSTGHSRQLVPRTVLATYTLTVHADAVPEGEVLRCWLPFPRSGSRRQDRIELIDSNLSNPVLAPEEYWHTTIYSEKTAVKGQPTRFQVRFRYRSSAERIDWDALEVRPYDKEFELYKKYVLPRETHVVFTDTIRRVSEEVVGGEKDPKAVVKRIFDWIRTAFPWAGAREYSTVPNIPEYMIENGHGDCGMDALLFITLCRYNGIPAKWQSGFVTAPDGGVGLHDWAEVYFEGPGWIPVDPSRAQNEFVQPEGDRHFYLGGTETYRLIVNDDYSRPLYPAKIYPRSETVDFQRGEVEWRGGNLYFNRWNWKLDVEYLDEPSKKP